MLTDSHCHLDDRQFRRDQRQVLERARQEGVDTIVCVGYDLPSSREVVALAEKHEGLYAVVGVHPHDAREVDEDTYRDLERLAQSPRVVAIGEMGLDYYRDLSPRQTQQQVFRRQIQLARRLQKPVVVHDREAHQEVMRILREEKAAEVGGVLHCFSGSWEMAQECLKLGFYISLAGPVTYHNARRPQEIACRVPLDRLLLETDAPYLTPEPLRGRRNEPANVRLVAEKIAALRGISLEELAAATTANARRVFRINKIDL